MSATKNVDKRTERLNFRLSPGEGALIHAAARVRGLQVSRYVVDSVCKQAQLDLADRHHFTIPARRMEAFRRALDRPPRVKPRLARLLSERTPLDGE